MQSSAKVFLVGAGPGDPGLFTMKGLDCIRRADCVIYDHLINGELLSQTKPGCTLYYAGKSAGSHSMRQAEINALLLDCAGKYEIVVRLKGGDPYVFGRGGEEALCLREAGIAFEVVPGVTSAIAGPAYAGIPISHRGCARSFHIITAHTSADDDGLDYVNLSKLHGTLVFLMGLSRVREICRGLIDGGMAADMPAAVISHATRSTQRTVTAALAQLPDVVEAENLQAPAIVVVGDVVALHAELDFFERKPLFGEMLLITRTSRQSAGLRTLLERMGAETVGAPMLELRPIPGALDAVIEKVETYDYVVFTSQNSLEIFFDALFSAGKDVRALCRTQLCVVGEATAKALRRFGLRADLCPETARAEKLLDILEPRLRAADHVLLPQSSAAKPVLREALKRLCTPDIVDVYDSVPPVTNADALCRMLADGEITGVTFTSSAAAENFHRAVGADTLVNLPCYSIGPVTSNTLRTLGLEPIESDTATIESLASCVESHVRRKKRCDP